MVKKFNNDIKVKSLVITSNDNDLLSTIVQMQFDASEEGDGKFKLYVYENNSNFYDCVIY